MTAQLFRRLDVVIVNTPEQKQDSGDTRTLEELIHHEEDCTGSIACSHNDSCGCICAGSDSSWTTSSDCRTPAATAGSGLRVDRRLPPVRRRPVCMDTRPLGSSTPSRRALGCAQVGPQRGSLGAGRRALAV